MAVQGIGGLGHLAIQYASRMGFRTIAVSHGADKKELARELGAHEYVDTAKGGAAEGLQEARRRRPRAGDRAQQRGDRQHAWTASSRAASCCIVAAPFEPLQLSVFPLLQRQDHRRLAERQRSIDSEETVAFSALTGVRPRIEVFKLEQAEQAFAKMMENRVRFRAVLTP